MTADRNPTAGTRSASEAAVVLAADAQPRQFIGIPFDLLAIKRRPADGHAQRYETGMTVAAHHHEHEQADYVISSRYRQTAAGTANELRPGGSYVIPGNVEHSLEVLEGVFVIDISSHPPRRLPLKHAQPLRGGGLDPFTCR